jgi:putative transposase
MTNHVHLLVTPAAAQSLPRLLQSQGRRYVQHVNRAYRRSGTLWEGRYKSTILDSETYVLACHRYIEANPLRAGMCVRPEDHRWSSYRGNALGRRDTLLTPHPVYHALGRSVAARRDAYRSLFDEILAAEIVATLRDATQRGWVPGSERFRAEIAQALARKVDQPMRGRPRKRREERDEGERLL